MSKKSLNKTTIREFSVIFEKLKNDGLIFRCSFAQISKHFLNEFLLVNAFSVDFETLKLAYLEHIEFEMNIVHKTNEHELNRLANERHNNEIKEAIKDENDFHKYICKSYFDLTSEPKEELLRAFIKATEDIKKIDDTLDDIKKTLDEIHTRNLTDEIQEKNPILYYYQEINERVKFELLNFIKDDIKDYALDKSYNNSFISSWFTQNIYRYKWNPDLYKPKYPNDLSNKMGNLPLPEFHKLCNTYKEDKTAFYSFLNKYISDEEIAPEIFEMTQKHHILASKKEIIFEAINIYQNGSKIMFACAVPTIIEGILHDLCLLIGEKENDLLQKGFQYKLDKLNNIFGWELYYEYYSFRFRLIRNKVAHGRLTKIDVDELADLLLLDLHQICHLVQSDKLKLNHKRFVIDELNKNILCPNYKFLMEYILLEKEPVPSFYNLGVVVEKIEELILGDKFWEFLESELNNGVNM